MRERERETNKDLAVLVAIDGADNIEHYIDYVFDDNAFCYCFCILLLVRYGTYLSEFVSE